MIEFRSLAKVVQLSMNCHRRVKQVRRYTGEPYEIHPAEVSALAASIWEDYRNEIPLHVFLAVAWLHDVFEDTDGTTEEVRAAICDWPINEIEDVLNGVSLLTDPVAPSRDERIRLQGERLAKAPRWVQGIKLCDNYANIKSIAFQDPGFAITYLEEKSIAYEGFEHSHPLANQRLNALISEIDATLVKQVLCPDCMTGWLVERNKDMPYVKNGIIQYLKEIHGKHCTRCAYVVLDASNLGPQHRSIRKAAVNNRHINIEEPE